MTRLEFELAYNDIVVQHVSHNTKNIFLKISGTNQNIMIKTAGH